MKSDLNKYKLDLNELEQNYQDQCHNIKQIKIDINDINQELNDKKDELDQCKIELDQFISEKTTLLNKQEYIKYKLHQQQHNSSVLNALKQANHNGRLHGIINNLGNLGSIDAKYDIAISTAAGSLLNNIVVDNTNNGRKAVEYLRTRKLGRATFILMDQIVKKWSKYTTKAISTPENVPRLYDLIQFDHDQYKACFYYALRDTLVAKDLEQAIRIAYYDNGQIKKRYRVVTLKGELIDVSGTMSGGGNKVKKGLMKLKNKNQLPTQPQQDQIIYKANDLKKLVNN